MRRSPIVLLALLLTLLLAACGGAPSAQPPAAPAAPPAAEPAAPTDSPPTAEPAAEPAPAVETTLNVFAAASLTDAFKAIAPGFEAAHPGVTVVYNFAGSQQLATQLDGGAPADVFASANRKQMDAAIASARVAGGSEQIFVRNQLVVIAPGDNPAGITTLQDLTKPGLKLILADTAVPVGQYALDFLAKASALPEYTETYSATVLSNVVSYENNVRVVLTKVALGEGDAGIVYTTDAALEADKLTLIAIPDELNTIASYPIAPVADSAAPELAQAFVDYVLSPAAQQVLAQYGFIRQH
ncbi:molybdate ABC transporter substrate-binding protein [Oscillochloris sp. ZM17-4]|uniref:molybdate ABC transporter substrate-binding protein n=1 Tax=Oscillochloris sp. ZM17-4 TaxID=2866714 RepID=UPI001C73932A|nr:molybdate ABC transporter substrate-binding protein [Oscillochloris sp. ZM17-4]MBX0327892.1 molybdate ABC transporter substrate-binding protein [Oscillochloris sp. ZM17-4]